MNRWFQIGEDKLMYKTLKSNDSFSNKCSTWIIAYCLDSNSFFATNERFFFWEYEVEFHSEDDAIKYFKNHLEKFWNIRKEILEKCGGWSINSDMWLENTKEKFKYKALSKQKAIL